MKAMLLCAGLGERMLPLTRLLPKPAIPVLGRPLAVQILHRLALEGVGTAVVNLHHEPEKLKTLLGDGHDLGLRELHYSYEESILGTAGGLLRAAPYLRGGGSLLVRNADFLSDIDLSAVTASHLASGCIATLVLAPARPGYPLIDVDQAGRVLSLAGAPPADPSQVAGRYLFTGYQLIEEEAIRLIPRGPRDLVRDLYRKLATDRQLASHVHGGFWWEFGAPLDYLEGSLALLGLDDEERTRIAETDLVERIGDAIVAVGCGADFHGGVELRGRIALGFASLVAEGTRLQDTVVMPEAWIGPGVSLRRTIVAPGTEVPAGFRAEDALICSDADPQGELPPDTERVNGLLVRQFAPRRS